MGFRSRLFVGLTLAVLLAAGAQAAIGYSLYKSWLDESATGYLNRYLSNLSEGVDMSGAAPTFDEGRLSYSPSDWSWIRYRLVEGATVYFEGPEAEVFPVSDPHWTRGAKRLDDGYQFELALNLEDIRQSLDDYTRTTLLTLALTLGVALGLIALLFRFSMQPIRRLTAATQTLTKQRFPEPVPVPPGNDEVSRLARSFNHMTEELRAFLERERSFTRYASHELRTPLSTLQAQTEALELDLLNAKTVIPTVKETVKQMERILNGLLTLARAGVLSLEPLELKPIIRDAIKLLPEVEHSRISASQAESFRVMGQYDLVQQAVFNLLENALKYSSGEVRVSLEHAGDDVTIIVRDGGLGVPDEVLKKLPEAFFQLNGDNGGAGLGLALVRHIAESLGGRLELRNLGEGFEACLCLQKAG